MTGKAAIRDVVLPFKILISPLNTFSQLAQKPSVKGLISLSAFILVVTAATQFASATKIDLRIDEQRTSFLVTDSFKGWFAGTLASTAFGILLYWLLFASLLMLMSRMLGGKETSWRSLLTAFAYLPSVFIVLYAVRAATFLALPPIYFTDLNSWPPLDTQADAALDLMSKSWGSLYAYQFGTFFTLFAFVWLVILSAIAVKALREVSWGKAAAVSTIGFSITLFLFGLP